MIVQIRSNYINNPKLDKPLSKNHTLYTLHKNKTQLFERAKHVKKWSIAYIEQKKLIAHELLGGLKSFGTFSYFNLCNESTT